MIELSNDLSQGATFSPLSNKKNNYLLYYLTTIRGQLNAKIALVPALSKFAATLFPRETHVNGGGINERGITFKFPISEFQPTESNKNTTTNETNLINT